MPTHLRFLPGRGTPTVFNVDTPDTKSITVDWIHEQDVLGVPLPDPYEIRRSDEKLPDWLMISYPTEPQIPFIIKVRYDPNENSERKPLEYIDEFSVRFPGIGYNSLQKFRIVVKIVGNEQPEEPANNVEQERDSNLECTICCDKYNEDTQLPRTMDCGHSFCERCLKRIKVEAVVREQPFLCPTDRLLTKTLVTELPANHHLVALMQKEKSAKQEKQKIMMMDPIVPCAENEKHESTLYCMQCQAAFCQSCFTRIHSYKFNAGHKTVPVAEQPIKIPMCSVHPDQQAEFYCTESRCIVNEIFCGQCSVKHKNHRTEPIKKRCQDNSVILKDLIEDLNGHQNRLDAIWNDTKTVADTFKPGGSMVRNAVKKIEEHFDKRKREAVFKLEGWAESKRMRIMQKADKIQNGLKSCETIKKEAEKTYGRKTRLHEDLDSLMMDMDDIAKVGEGPDNLFYFSAYFVSKEMTDVPYLPRPVIKEEDPVIKKED